MTSSVHSKVGAPGRAPVLPMVEQHLGDCATCYERRVIAVRSPGHGLLHLSRIDEFLSAHVDALMIEAPRALSIRMNQDVGNFLGERFVTVLLLLAAADLAFAEGLVPALESPERPMSAILRDVIDWLPGDLLSSLADRASGTQGQLFTELVCTLALRGLEARAGERTIQPLTSSAPPGDAYVAVVERALLGAHEAETLERLSLEQGASRQPSMSVALRAIPRERARAILDAIALEPDVPRELIHGVAALGDPFYIPWLIAQMSDPALTRLAGESFSMITGLDLAYLDLDRKPPEDFEPGPNDNPDDDNVDMDPDDGLPWPDPGKIAAWWRANEQRFPAGQRFFMGQPPSMAHCLQVLETGYQRQRMAAAIWRCILQPGTPLFPTDAPAWRQKRWLAQMSV